MLGRSLGNYHVVSKIGEGGMGAVYLARHMTLGRPAAIKVLHPSLSSDQDMVTRFFNEARAATTVRNPGIVEVFDFGVLEDRSAFIVMEYLEGESLGARLRSGRLPVAATMTIVRAIARALQAAHEHGIVHRDLKPDNVFLVPDPELASGERVKLLDFGIAKLAPISGEVSQTRTGMVMGTPTYMAPEQCRGAGAVDQRADLYALGCVAYHMMCGQPPFVSEGAGDLIARHLYFQPAPLRSLCPEVPADVDALVLWLLQKDPAARPASAAELIRAIDHLAVASVLGVMQTQPPTRFSATSLAPVVETTLRGAASSNVGQAGGASRPRRAGLVVAIAAGAVSVAAVLVVALGRHDPAGPVPPVAAPAAAGDRSLAPPASAASTPASPARPPAAAPVAAPPVAAPQVAAVPPQAPGPAATPGDEVAEPAAPDRSDGGGRRKPSSSSRSRIGERAVAGTVKPEPAPAAVVAAPVAHMPVPEPPQAAPPTPAPKPAAAPGPAGSRAPPLVPASAVSKLSGTIPVLAVKGGAGELAAVVVKLCIDEQGAVASVKVVKAPPDVAGELERGLKSWRYTPYVNPLGVQSAACFAVSFHVVSGS